VVVLFALFLAFVWGVVWAVFLQFSQLGRFLAARRTWLTVVIGIGVDLAIALMVIPWRFWWLLFGIVFMSGIGIIARSLLNEWRSERHLIEEIIDGDENADPK